jgi:hypothetical protein
VEDHTTHHQYSLSIDTREGASCVVRVYAAQTKTVTAIRTSLLCELQKIVARLRRVAPVQFNFNLLNAAVVRWSQKT